MRAPDTEQPDAAILDAFEKVRAHRAYAYSFDDLPEGQPIDPGIEAAIEATDAEMPAHEAVVHGTAATTIAGVLVRLQLVLPAMDQSRWVDRTLMQNGLLALCAERSNLESEAQQVASAAHDLLNLAWAQALEAYQTTHANFMEIIDAKATAESEQMAQRRSGTPNPFAEKITKQLDALEVRFGAEDVAGIHRLIQTPAPDWQAYRLKAEIALKEGFANEAGEWLLRDVNALLAAQAGGARA